MTTKTSRNITIFLSLTLSLNANASPTGVITDIFEIQIDALEGTSQKAIANIAGNMEAQLENVYAIVDSEVGKIDLNDPDILTKVVDEIAKNPVIASRSGLAGSLSSIVQAIDVTKEIKKIKDIANIPNDLKDILDNGREAANELADLVKSDSRGEVLKNLLEYGSGRRDGKLQAMLLDINKDQYKNLFNIAKALDNINNIGSDVSEKIFGTLINVSKMDIASEMQKNLSNPAWTKIVIQDMVVKKWREGGIINDSNINQFNKQHVYSKAEEGIFFKTPIVEKIFYANNKYQVLTDSQISSIQYNETVREAPGNVEQSNGDLKKLKAEKKENLSEKTNEINEKEKALGTKKKELDDKKKELANTDKFINKNSENTQTSYDRTKLAYLQEAQRLVDKYGKKSATEWSDNDRIKLSILAKKIGTDQGTLYWQLRLGNFNSLRNKFASTSTVSSSVESIENMDYKNIKGQISALMNEIKTLNQGLTLDRMQQADLQISVNNLNSINDVNNGNKVQITKNNSTPPHEDWWQGSYTRNYYYENNLGEAVLSGFGDGPARTNESKPNTGVTLYLDKSDDGTDIERTRTLQNTASEYFGDYNYVAWGTWSDPNAVNKIYTSHWVVVNQLDRGQVPHTGTAKYKGELNGTLFNIGQANTIHNANGDITMDADFAKNSINGTLNVRNADNGAPFAEAKFDTMMRSTADGDGLNFGGALKGAGISNDQTWHSQISGEFGGDQAAEAGGTWSVTKGTGSVGDGRATGVFRAEKQPQ